MKQNEPAQLHCDEDKKKCLTLVDEKCLTPLRERYNTQEFNEYLTNGCQVDINFHNIVKGPKYSLGNEQVIPPIPSPTNYAKITTNPVIPQLITTTTSPTKLTTSKVSAPNSITITCDNNVENCRVSYYPPLNNNEKIIVTLQKQGQSKQKIHCDPGVTVWVNDQHDNVIANGISPEQVKYLENIRCTQSKGHQQTSPTVPSTRSPDTEAVADIPNIFNNPTYRTLPNSLASDTTFAAQNNAAVSTPSADPGDISRNMLFSIFSILGVGVGALLAGCGYYMYRKREHNKKTANRDPENNITHIEDPSKKTKDKKLYHSPYSKPIKQKPYSSVQKKQKVINKKQVEESATLVLENVEDEGITIEHNDDKLDRKAMLPHLIAVFPALNNNLQEERENYGEGAGMFVDETNDHAELPVPMVGEGSDLL
ncbi:hypothetical protein [Candidatus Tisiphia endosymbiont of Beris chalybata]|uniref:hypothetical protein n=1 Tax=Candidatus Tisiphia endosymbiont of Beris chalybata TaxID=3066262 RepID=UPI00312C71B8